MELGKVNRSLIVQTFWRGAVLRLNFFVFWPWCLTMAATTGNWIAYPILMAVTLIVRAVFKQPALPSPQVS